MLGTKEVVKENNWLFCRGNGFYGILYWIQNSLILSDPFSIAIINQLLDLLKSYF